MSSEQVRDYYSRISSTEWKRLVQDPYHRLEFDTTLHFLRKYLPRRGHVLDAGGGPGRYTIELARLGYDVTLFDLTPRLLDIARRQIKRAGVQDRVKDVMTGSIDNLTMFRDRQFDAVVCLGGAFSHLVSRRRRAKAGGELIRVARTRAPVFIAVISRPVMCMYAVIRLEPEMLTAPDIFWKYTLNGDYHGSLGFTPTHFFTPEELRHDFRNRMRILDMVGLEGFFSTHSREYNRAIRGGKHNAILRELHLKTCTDPTAVGISEHFMIIGRKR